MSDFDSPSRLARRLLRWALPDDRRDDITGDLDEVFANRRRERGLAAARRWYWREALMLAGRFLVERIRDRCGPRARAGASSGSLHRRLMPGISLIDLKLGLRMLLKYPGLTLVSTAALAIAIAIIAGFHTATAFMVRPTLPVPDGNRVVAVWQHDMTTGDPGMQTVGDMVAWRDGLETLDGVGAFRLRERGLAVNGAMRLVRAAEITPSVFEMIRIAPQLGRPLVAGDAQPGSPPVALIGFDLWQSALDADPAVVGGTIRLGGIVHTVVGVMPDGFAFPRHEAVWTPLPVTAAGASPGTGPAIDFAVARLAADATLEQAEAELTLAGARLAAAYPNTHAQLRPRITRYAQAFIESSEPGLAILMHAARIAIGVVLLVVAVNVGTLIYARNAARLGETAVRMALGASRGRVVWQTFIESLLLCSLAAAVGVALLLWPLYLFKDVFDTAVAQGDGLPYWFEVGLGADTVLLVVVLTLLSAVLTGVLPALKLTGRQLQARLQRVQEGNTGLRFGRTTTLVVVTQVALSVALLTVGGAQLRTFIEDWWSRDDTAMAYEQFLTAELRQDLAPDAVGDAQATSARIETRRELGRRAAAEPDVLGVTFERYQGIRFFAPDLTTARDASPGVSWSYLTAIDPNYFDVRGAPIRAGRALGESDLVDSAAPVAVVNEAFVEAMLPPGDPIGHRIRAFEFRTGQLSGTGEWVRIVGVVRNTPGLEISHRGPQWLARPTVYLPLQDTMSGAGARMLLRSRGAPERLVGRLQALAAEVDPTLVVHQPRTLDDANRVGLTLAGLYGIAVGFFVFAALLLSTTGVYAMMSFTATQRTREIGIRAALGAPAARVIGAVFSRAMKQLGVGTALGIGLGYLAADGPFALSGGLFANGPGVIIGVAVLILAMGLIACGRPVRRALRVQPTEALRADA